MSLIETCTERLAAAIRTGDVYKRYKKALDELKLKPEEKAKMEELRILNYRMQNEERTVICTRPLIRWRSVWMNCWRSLR